MKPKLQVDATTKILLFTRSLFMSTLVTCLHWLAARSITSSSDSAAWVDGCLFPRMHLWKESSPFTWFVKKICCCQGLKYLPTEARAFDFDEEPHRLFNEPVHFCAFRDGDGSGDHRILCHRCHPLQNPGHHPAATAVSSLPLREPPSSSFIAGRHRRAFQSEPSRLIRLVSFILPRFLFSDFFPLPTTSHPFRICLFKSSLATFLFQPPSVSSPSWCSPPSSPTNTSPHISSTPLREEKEKKKKLRLPWVLSTLLRVRHSSVPAALRWHFKLCASP